MRRRELLARLMSPLVSVETNMEQNLTQMGAGETLDVNTAFQGWVSKISHLTAAEELYVCGVSLSELVEKISTVQMLADDILNQVKDCPTQSMTLDREDQTPSRPWKYCGTPLEMATALWESLEDKVWVIDIGNSSEGQVGATIRMTAKTEAHAIESAKEWFSYCFEDDQSGDDTVRIFCNYINWDNVTTDNVSEEEE